MTETAWDIVDKIVVVTGGNRGVEKAITRDENRAGGLWDLSVRLGAIEETPTGPE